jgi:hypothetical protein
MMNIAVRYQSRGGNSKAVAEAIAKAVGVTAEPIGKPIIEPVDILFVGGGMYAWDIDKRLKAYLHSLSPDLVKSVAAFTTGTMMSGTSKIAAIVKARGIAVNPEVLPFKAGMKNYHLFGGEGTLTLAQKQLVDIAAFAKKAKQQIVEV